MFPLSGAMLLQISDKFAPQIGEVVEQVMRQSAGEVIVNMNVVNTVAVIFKHRNAGWGNGRGP